MEAAVTPHLRMVVDRETGEVTDAPCPHCRELEYELQNTRDSEAGYKRTTEKQARMIGALERKVIEEEDPNSHPQGAQIVALVERWKRGTGHSKARVSADRIKLVKARLRDGYPLNSDADLPDEATLELAVDGIAAFPFVVNGQRQREGKASQRHDRLGIALAGGEKVEEFARLGYQARKGGLVTWA